MLGSPGASCTATCQSHSMTCSVQQQREIVDAVALQEATNYMVAGLNCQGAALPVAAGAAPALDAKANSCAVNGASSTCDAVPATGVRLCYCKPRWAQSSIMWCQV